MSEAVSTLLPPNATGLETALATVAARVSDVPVPVDRLWTPKTCPADLLPWLAWALSVDTWDAAWPEAVKRDVIAASFAVHKRKGTVGAVKRALAALGVDVDLVEWWQETPQGTPHTFRVMAWANANLTLDGEAVLNGRVQESLIQVVETTKPVRSHYDLKVGAKFDAGLTIRAATSAHQTVRRTGTPPPHPVHIKGGRLGVTTGAAPVSVVQHTAEPPPHPVHITGGRLGVTVGAAPVAVVRRAMDAGAPAAHLGAISAHIQAAGRTVTLLRASMEPHA